MYYFKRYYPINWNLVLLQGLKELAIRAAVCLMVFVAGLVMAAWLLGQ